MARSDFKLKLTRTGPRQVRTSAGVAADGYRRAQRIAAAAGPGMQASSTPGRNRARASVVTVTVEAMRAEARYRRLTSSIDAGR